MQAQPAPAGLSASMIDELARLALASPRRRQHRNLHASYADPCQRFFNALCADSYIPPHRHLGSTDEETLIAVRGDFLTVLFNGDGEIDEVLPCGLSRANIGAVIPVGRWHTVLPLNDMVLLEIKAGPFDPGRAKEFASWAPSEGSSNVAAYQDQLRARCLSWLR